MTDPQPGTPSAGSMLRAAREKQGLHIAALAAAIKVSPRKLDALEADRWQDLPDATFTRALAQTVCRTLKVDAAPVLALLPPAGALPLAPIGNTQNQPFRDRPGRDGSAFGASAIKPLAWAGVVLMVAAVVVYFLPTELWSTGGDAATAPAPVLQAAPPATASPTTPMAVTEPPLTGAPSAAPASAAALAASAALQMAAQPAGETVFSTPSGVAASAPVGTVAGAAAAAAVAAGMVQLSASEPSWVEARDGRGVVLLSRTVMPGESVGLDGGLPIRLTVGNAAGMQVLFRGQPVDLASHTRENVARLELQ